jgi:RNA polymerase sigma-70 factor (ECF subfamily)
MTITTDDARDANPTAPAPENERADEHRETEWSDEELLLCYQATGRRSLFDELVRRYERELYSYLHRYLGDADQAEDVFQATFLRVHLKCGQFEAGRKVKPWLYAVATNAAIDAQRRDRRHRLISLERASTPTQGAGSTRLVDTLVSPNPDPLSEVSQLESGEWVQGALDDLTEQLRSVVTLVYYQGLKYREAADVLNVPVGTVKSRLHAAVRKLNEFWHETHKQQP